MKIRMVTESIIYKYQQLIEKKLKKGFDGRFVAMFHQVDDDEGKWYDNQYAISFLGFQKFVDGLDKAGYEIVSPYDILGDNGKKKAVLSFDDAFDGVYYHVYPFLKARNIPFVIFPTISKLQEAGYVNEKMLKEMTDEYAGCYVGAHGILHCNLLRSSEEVCREEIVESGNMLAEILEKKIDIFAYPYGAFNAVGKREHKIAAQRYKIAFGTLQAGVTADVNPFYIPRMNINEANYVNRID